MDDSPANRMLPHTPIAFDFESLAAPTVQPLPYKIRIPSFPAFKPLELTDQYEIEQWVRHFAPYSDFNFVSLWCWNTSSEFEICWLNDNLVVLFNDYGTGERFFSFIGTNHAGDTARTLIDYARSVRIAPVLRLLPHETARHLLNEPGLIIRRSPQHADYVLSTLAWSRMEGGHFKNKRNEIAKLERAHHPEIREIVLSDPDIQQEMTDLFGRWVIERNRAGRQDTVIESLALRRVFSLDRPQDLLAFGLYVDGQMIAYSINERLSGEYAMGHHWKSAGHYPGAYPLMLRHTCRTLAAEGRRFLNIQQDLGEPGLQRSKQLYRPERYLHKYELEAETDPRELSGIPLRIFISAPQPAPLELGWMDSSHVG